MAPDSLLTPREVADILRVHMRTVVRMAREGDLRGIRVGLLWRFERAAIEAYLAQQRSKAVERVT
jgi:excisionase family DNA binding protein